MSSSSPATPTSITPASRWRSCTACWRQAGFRVAILSQPDWKTCEPWRQFGRPRLFFAVSAGNMDSLINHYTANKKVRNDDAYSPGGRIGLRPDRATLRLLPAGPRGVPRRAGDRRRRRGVAAPARPLRLLERHGQALDPARLQGRPRRLRHGRGQHRRDRPTAGSGRKCQGPARPARGRVRARRKESEAYSNKEDTTKLPDCNGAAYTLIPSYEQVRDDKLAFAEATRLIHTNTNPFNAADARAVPRPAGGRADPPALPLSQAEMDAVYDLPYTRRPHPSYTEPIPAYEMIKDSVTIMRGCFGGCTFCSITAHQGRIIQSRSQESVLKRSREAGGRPGVQGHRSATSAGRPRTCTRCAARGRRSRRSASGCRASIRPSASCSAPTTGRSSS